MNQDILDEEISESLQHFVASLRTTFWSSTATEKTVDSSFKCALELEDILQKDRFSHVRERMKRYCDLNSTRPIDILMRNILQNHNIDENLILYAIEKYILFFSKSDFSKLLNEILSEIELRGQIFKLIEVFPDVDLDFYRMNNFLCDLLKSSDLKSQILNYFKTHSAVFFKAIKHSTASNKQFIIDELIACLESQTDLRLWFLIMKDENLDIVLDLCEQYEHFLKKVFNFFDKFANETESNYDEDLNVIYSHVNLDFEDFVKILQLFLSKKGIHKAVYDYLESKTLTDKNFSFWIDVKACL